LAPPFPENSKTRVHPEKSAKLKFSAAWRESRLLIHEHRKRLAISFVLMILGRASGFVLPYTLKLFADRVIGMHETALLPWLLFYAAVATVIQTGTSYALSQMLGVAAQHAINEMRKRMHAHVMRLPVRYFDATQTGVLIARIMTDAEGLRNLVGNGIVQLAGGLFTAAIAVVFLFSINGPLTLAMLVVIGGFGGAMSFAFSKLRPMFRERGKINAEVTGRLAESVSGIRVVKTYIAEPREREVFGKGVDRLFDRIRTTMVGVSAMTAGANVVIGAAGVLTMLIGGHAILDGKMTLGDLLMYMTVTALLTAPVMQMAAIGTQISEAFAGLDRIREVMGETPEDAADNKLLPCPIVRGDVEFDGVTFEYNPGVPVLRNVSFETPAGSTTALVGSSGSGKSTLISLVMAFNRPIKGMVRIDGNDLATLRLRDYRANLGVVLQDNFLFDGTVRENIAFSKPGATLEDIQAASRVAHSHDFITEFKDGYDTVVGERGVKLSGGQRQRIAIARALLANPRILILDEATSSLDSESEGLIQEGLRALRQGRTTFVIAHRLSTIRSADQILVLEAGQIVERGAHEELLAFNGRYRQLYDKQYRFENERFVNPGEEFTAEAVRKA
jgi:ABC-type multidrug transport system fused ATPase/permease subunit